MKKGICILPALVLALLLSACGGGAPPDGAAEGPGALLEGEHVLTARIIENDGGRLLLAGLTDPWDDLYTVSADDLSAIHPDELRAGELLQLAFDGSVEETRPARLGNITGAAVAEDGRDRLYQLYLDVLDDLWEKDPGLHDGISQIGFDLASTRLTPSEQAATALVFAREHGDLPAVFGTRQELADAGLIDEENLVWDDGVLLSIREKNDEHGRVLFDAEMWRSGLGAYLFCDCESRQIIGGDWAPYSVGGEAVS